MRGRSTRSSLWLEILEGSMELSPYYPPISWYSTVAACTHPPSKKRSQSGSQKRENHQVSLYYGHKPKKDEVKSWAKQTLRAYLRQPSRINLLKFHYSKVSAAISAYFARKIVRSVWERKLPSASRTRLISEVLWACAPTYLFWWACWWERSNCNSLSLTGVTLSRS